MDQISQWSSQFFPTLQLLTKTLVITKNQANKLSPTRLMLIWFGLFLFCSPPPFLYSISLFSFRGKGYRIERNSRSSMVQNISFYSATFTWLRKKVCLVDRRHWKLSPLLVVCGNRILLIWAKITAGFWVGFWATKVLFPWEWMSYCKIEKTVGWQFLITRPF